ncbi:DUF1102 domain-containing protein [Natrarchaeobaculum sulfurireducens]|nr:DUF1102 domain-containing protein [Natrarchaeobaculum sulfurireducens]AXR77112.1 hypothetical protein AArc1_0770 [Natrarchaeobaculum sulfurireducens]
MQRRKFVIGVGALASGAAAAVGTGAFTSVEASRDVGVELAEDANAYLALTAERDDIISDDGSDGTLSIDLGSEETDEGGAGFNDDAVTEIDGVFRIENQGTQDSVSLDLDESDVQDGVTFKLQEDTIDAGEGTLVDVTVDTLNEDPEKEDGTLVVGAEA